MKAGSSTSSTTGRSDNRRQGAGSPVIRSGGPLQGRSSIVRCFWTGNARSRHRRRNVILSCSRRIPDCHGAGRAAPATSKAKKALYCRRTVLPGGVIMGILLTTETKRYADRNRIRSSGCGFSCSRALAFGRISRDAHILRGPLPFLRRGRRSADARAARIPRSRLYRPCRSRRRRSAGRRP